MKKWEYKTVIAPGVEDQTNLGLEGWELAAILPISGGDDLYYFKRELAVPEPQGNAACIRCGAPYLPNGSCSRSQEGCQGGIGEWPAHPQGWVEAAAYAIQEILLADSRYENRVTPEMFAAIIRKHAPTAEEIAEAVRVTLFTIPNANTDYAKHSLCDDRVIAAIQAVLGRGK